MSEEPVVSIITPCYNGENHVHRLINSILTQTYTHIEFIFVNDGSTDNTERIVLSFKDKLESKGIKLVYILQENKGVGSAINEGLKKVTGEYLCWPDSDDYFEPESVEMRLRILEKFPDFTVVTSDAYIRSIDNLNVVLGLVSASFKTNNDPNQFLHLLNARSIFVPGTHMVRTKAFFETHPSGEIYPARSGQNWQMLLPVYYLHKRYFLNKPLFNYIRSGSNHSQNEYVGFIKRIITYNNHREILVETLSAMNMVESEKTYYLNMVRSRYSHLIFRMAYNQQDFDRLNQEYNNIKNLNQITFKIRLKIIISRIKRIFLSFFGKP